MQSHETAPTSHFHPVLPPPSPPSFPSLSTPGRGEKKKKRESERGDTGNSWNKDSVMSRDLLPLWTTTKSRQTYTYPLSPVHKPTGGEKGERLKTGRRGGGGGGEWGSSGVKRQLVWSRPVGAGNIQDAAQCISQRKRLRHTATHGLHWFCVFICRWGPRCSIKDINCSESQLIKYSWATIMSRLL